MSLALFSFIILLFILFDLRFDEDFVSLQVWCYERLTPLAPRRKGQALFPVPCVERWKVSRSYARHGSLSPCLGEIWTGLQLLRSTNFLFNFFVILFNVFICLLMFACFYRLIRIPGQLRG